jgi:hypothetical protein
MDERVWGKEERDWGLETGDWQSRRMMSVMRHSCRVCPRTVSKAKRYIIPKGWQDYRKRIKDSNPEGMI